LRNLAVLPLLLLLPGLVGAEPSRRLPEGYRVGRCLYVDRAHQRIAGRCFYKLAKDGAFHIDGPRQVYDGIDYPRSLGMADRYSRDWWADVFPLNDGWAGYGNESIADVHGGRLWSLRRKGDCFIGEGVKVCLWRQ